MDTRSDETDVQSVYASKTVQVINDDGSLDQNTQHVPNMYSNWRQDTFESLQKAYTIDSTF